MLLSATEGDDIPPIFGINKGDFDITPELMQNVREIYYKFVKPLYPIKNKYLETREKETKTIHIRNKQEFNLILKNLRIERFYFSIQFMI